ncbi:alpha/beta hydrolase [Alkalicaulis satelles]|uniref:Alpha/beta hydrolase n=1 Tax=Alkalicaulis satelles TaxID=2609175 RepID=A0A5M6ZI37_9PROT|nr:alpha/beta hydrolase [Alkalicaulis satelles]KAA5803970.1 alpha/beta hydrolase [Alkalicaulis satelles]
MAVLVLSACAAGAGRSSDIAERFAPDGAFLTVQDVALHYHVTGPEGAPAVLALHGASANLHELRSALEGPLAHYRVIWLDRPGLGWSERPSGAWSPQREAALIAAFLDAMETGPVTVIGHSWGGAITLRLMMDHPDKTAGAVLIAPALRAHVGEAAFYNRATLWPVVGPVITHAVVPLSGPGQLESGAASAFHPEPLPDNYVERVRLALILRPGPWRANAEDMARVNDHLAAQEERYGEITQPVILIAGPQDSVVSTRRHAHPVAETLPAGELRELDAAGHNPHHGEAGAAAVVEALETVRARLTAPDARNH